MDLFYAWTIPFVLLTISISITSTTEYYLYSHAIFSLLRYTGWLLTIVACDDTYSCIHSQILEPSLFHRTHTLIRLKLLRKSYLDKKSYLGIYIILCISSSFSVSEECWICKNLCTFHCVWYNNDVSEACMYIPVAPNMQGCVHQSISRDFKSEEQAALLERRNSWKIVYYLIGIL